MPRSRARRRISAPSTATAILRSSRSARRQPICAARSNARSPASSTGSGTTIRSRRAARPRSRWSSRPCGRAPISQAETDVRLNELEREAQSDRALYEAFLNRAKETGEQQSLQIAEARIASPALVPIKLERPPALLLLAAAAILGLSLGIGLVLILEQLRRTFRSAEEVEQALGVRTLGVLPLQAGTDIKHAVRYVIDQPTSDYAGSLWSLMTRLQRTQAQKQREVLAIVSAVPNEGKSTLASFSAIAYAASSLKTPLIDGDCYAMSVTSAFGLNRPGLNEVLEGRAKLSNTLVRDAQSGLFVLAARDPSSAARETGDKALASLLRDLRDQFELIIVDCPAILPVDGGSFVEHADHIAFVIAWDETERAAVEEAFAMLGSHFSKLIGVVRARPRHAGTGRSMAGATCATPPRRPPLRRRRRRRSQP